MECVFWSGNQERHSQNSEKTIMYSTISMKSNTFWWKEHHGLKTLCSVPSFGSSQLLLLESQRLIPTSVKSGEWRPPSEDPGRQALGTQWVFTKCSFLPHSLPRKILLLQNISGDKGKPERWCCETRLSAKQERRGNPQVIVPIISEPPHQDIRVWKLWKVYSGKSTPKTGATRTQCLIPPSANVTETH